MTAAPLDDLVTVRVLALPVPVHLQAQQHGDELRREFRLLTEQVRDDAHGVPRRLIELMHVLSVDYGGFTTEQEAALDEAADRGAPTVDLVFRVPAGAAAAARALGDLLDEADAYCAAGQHLLTLATPPELVAYRRWYLGEFIGQIAGAEPTPWPAYATTAP